MAATAGIGPGRDRDTLHRSTQIVGKVRLAHALGSVTGGRSALYVSPRGLTTSAIPHRDGAFDIEFDFADHQLRIRPSDGGGREVALKPTSVAQFYTETMAALGELGIQTLWVPNWSSMAVTCSVPGGDRRT